MDSWNWDDEIDWNMIVIGWRVEVCSVSIESDDIINICNKVYMNVVILVWGHIEATRKRKTKSKRKTKRTERNKETKKQRNKETKKREFGKGCIRRALFLMGACKSRIWIWISKLNIGG